MDPCREFGADPEDDAHPRPYPAYRVSLGSSWLADFMFARVFARSGDQKSSLSHVGGFRISEYRFYRRLCTMEQMTRFSHSTILRKKLRSGFVTNAIKRLHQGPVFFGSYLDSEDVSHQSRQAHGDRPPHHYTQHRFADARSAGFGRHRAQGHEGNDGDAVEDILHVPHRRE